MNKSVMRNIKNLSFIWLMYMGMVICVMLCMALMTVLLGIHDIKETIENNVLYLCCFVSLIVNARLSMMDIPMIISFGSRRKDCLIAKYIVNIIFIVVMCGLVSAIKIYNGDYIFNEMLFIYAEVIASTGFGIICGIVVGKFGRIGYVVFIGVLCGAMGILATTVVAELAIIKFSSIGISSLLASVVFAAISIAIEYNHILKIDIKI